ncbi:hypothetical protein [Actinophytocola sp.]|uniref:hypothetical protein n=1 Tax=Actinophytocola sp. TaxID=1872138 RepID=UPI003899A2D0
MTYPPQGPYGQQPDPYGQQQPQYGGGYPQQQPQQPQQPQYGGGYDPNAQYGNAQYGGGYTQYGGLGGGPQPPKNNKGPIIAIVTIVVLVLAGVGITGFVAPGFFLSDDGKGGNTATDGTKTSGNDKAGGADDFIQKLVAAADDKDKDALEGYQCSTATDSVKGATKDIDEISNAKLKDTDKKSDTKVVATLSITVDGSAGDYDVTVVKDGGDWCWKDISAGNGGLDETSESTTSEDTSTSNAPPATGDTDGEKFIQSFLDKLNSGDGAGAAGMSCSDSTSQGDITEAATKSPQLQMDPAGTTADDTYVGADLKGTLSGQTASGRTSAFVESGNWCIYTFFAS